MKKTTQSCCLMVGVLVKDVAHVVASTYNNKNSYFAEQTVKSKVDFFAERTLHPEIYRAPR